jgi:hypothetical protein
VLSLGDGGLQTLGGKSRFELLGYQARNKENVLVKTMMMNGKNQIKMNGIRLKDPFFVAKDAKQAGEKKER